MAVQESKVLFVGKQFEPLSRSGNLPFHAEWLKSEKELLQHMIDEHTIPSDEVVFLGLDSSIKAESFVKEAEKSVPQSFLITPYVACFSNDAHGCSEEVLRKFDYVLNATPEEKDIAWIVHFATLRKREIFEKTTLNFIRQEILFDLFEKQIDPRRTLSKEALTSPQQYYGVDQSGIVNTMGDEILSILGFSREEIVGHHFSELVAKEEFERVKNAFTERRTGSRGTKEITVKLKTKKGDYKDFVIDAQGVHVPSVSEHPQKDPHRVYLGTFGNVKPKAVSVDSFDVFVSSLEPIIIYNLTDEKLIVNRGFERFSGYKREEIIDMRPSSFERPDRSSFDQYANSVQDRGHYEYNTIFMRKSGEEIPCEVSLDLTEFEGKSLLIGIYSDLTHFVKLIDEAETIIQLSWDIGNTTSLEELIEAAALKGRSILRVPFLALGVMKESAREINRYYVQSVKARNWYTLQEAEFHQCLHPLVQEAFFEKKTVYRAVSEVFCNCDLSHFLEEAGNSIVVVSPLIVSAKAIGCMIVIQEKNSTFTLQGIRLLELSTNVIAAGIYKLRLESELRKNLALLESRVHERTQELEDFIYTISHDLKSPLHAARGFADMVRKQYEPMIKNDEEGYMLKRIGENIEQSISMINDLLMLSRIGTRKLKIEEVDLNVIISDYGVQYNALNNKDVHLEIEVDERIPVIHADAVRMTQLFTNLFDNSIKYRREKTVKIVIEWEKKGNTLKLMIGDNGVGIDEKELEHVFKVFYRGGTAEKAVKEGSGLGLTIVKKIVQQHGGTIDIKSKLNCGTTVFIDLPIK